MGSDESRFNVSLLNCVGEIHKDSVHKQQLEERGLEERGDQNRTAVLPLTGLTPYR